MQLVASSKRHEGIAVLDASTAAHFGIGTAAGLSGIDPKMALLIALLAEGAYEVVKQRDPEAIFERGVGQSKINEVVDLLALVAGAYLGGGIRTKIKEQPVAAVAPAAAPPAVVSGLGATTQMHLPYSVWEWDEYNGWALFFSSNSQGSANQVQRALQSYQPQKYYGVYGSYWMNAAYEIYGYWGRTRYSWGYTVEGDPKWILVYALSKIMRPEVYVNARYIGARGTQPIDQIGAPSWIAIELHNRALTAEKYGTLIA